MNKNYIFGYGSLVDEKKLIEFLGRKNSNDDNFLKCKLLDYKRVWNVAEKNKLREQDGRQYIHPIRKDIPDVEIVFLNIEPEKNSYIHGILFEVTDEELAMIDKRERSYKRTDVSNLIYKHVEGTVWTYEALESHKELFNTAVENNRAVIVKGYYDLVLQSYKNNGKDYIENYLNTTSNIDSIPIRDYLFIKDMMKNK